MSSSPEPEPEPQWGSNTDGDFVAWAVLFYGLAIVCVITNSLLLLIIPSSRVLRSRISSLFYWSMAFWHLMNAIFHTPPSFQGMFPGLGKVPRGMPWLCFPSAFTMDVCFNVEVLSIICLCAGYMASLRKKRRPVDLYWGKALGWGLAVFIWLWSIGVSVPWAVMKWQWYSDFVAFGLAAVFAIVALVVSIVAMVKTHRKSSPLMHQDAKGEVKALLAIVIKFCLSWLFTWIYFLIRVIDPDVIDKKWPFFNFIILIIKYLHEHPGLWNFLFLPLFVPAYKQAYIDFFTCRCNRKPSPKRQLTRYDIGNGGMGNGNNKIYAHPAAQNQQYQQQAVPPTMATISSGYSTVSTRNSNVPMVQQQQQQQHQYHGGYHPYQYQQPNYSYYYPHY